MVKRSTIICVQCGLPGPRMGRGLCGKCYFQQRYLDKDKKAAIIEASKKWRVEHIAHVRQYKSAWNRSNRVAVRAYARNRLKTDINYRVLRRLRKRVWSALRGRSKSAHTMELLGCTIDQLKQHLESRFLPGMSWDNYGKWHVDHIIACATFDLTKEAEQRRCFNYTNLQPLWASDNIRKGTKSTWSVSQ